MQRNPFHGGGVCVCGGGGGGLQTPVPPLDAHETTKLHNYPACIELRSSLERGWGGGGGSYRILKGNLYRHLRLFRDPPTRGVCFNMETCFAHHVENFYRTPKSRQNATFFLKKNEKRVKWCPVSTFACCLKPYLL